MEVNHLMRSENRSGRYRDLAAVVAITLLVGLIYSVTYHVPWYFDDSANITGNQMVHRLDRPVALLFSFRGPALLSFALNYAIHGESLPGYHVVNNLIHTVAAIMVYFILLRIVRGDRRWALIGALVFACHPIQTQSVTYIVQRMTSLAALFAFACLWCYICGRDTLSSGAAKLSARHISWYAAMMLFCGLAVATKQNTAFLPVGLYVFGRYFLDNAQGWSRRRSMLYLTPFVIPPVYVAYGALIVPLLKGAPLSQIGSMGSNVNPLNYFVTEWRVVWIYLRLLFVPMGQTLDYNYPLVTQILSGSTLFAGVGVVALWGLAWRIRNNAPEVSFAIVWFFLALAVESSFLPLDVMFEHRLYFPMFGFAVFFIWLWRQIPWRWAGVVTVVLLIAVYSTLTVRRNILWSDQVAFNEDNLRKAPRNERIYLELARLYMERKRLDEAEKLLVKGLEINPRQGKLYDNLGSLYDLKGDRKLAIEIYQRGISLDPDYEKLYINLAVVYAAEDKLELADGLLAKALQIRWNNPSTYFNRGVIQYRMRHKAAALANFRRAIECAPYDQDSLYNLAQVAAETGDMKLARETAEQLQRINMPRGRELLREILANSSAGQ